MNIGEETKAHAVFNGLLTRKEREMLPTPQGEKEKEVRSQLCTRSALLEAQLYDTIKTTTPEKPVISGLPRLSVTNVLLFSVL